MKCLFPIYRRNKPRNTSQFKEERREVKYCAKLFECQLFFLERFTYWDVEMIVNFVFILTFDLHRNTERIFCLLWKNTWKNNSLKKTNKTKMSHDWNEKQRTSDVQIDENISFDKMMLSDRVLLGLTKNGFTQPSPIQLRAIPLGISGLGKK